MAAKTAVKIEKLPDGRHKQWGEFDSGGRWFPEAALQVSGAFDVRSPSRRWPYSYLKHFYSVKFARRLAAEAPRLYMEVAGIDEHSDLGKRIIAAYAARRMQAAA